MAESGYGLIGWPAQGLSRAWLAGRRSGPSIRQITGLANRWCCRSVALLRPPKQRKALRFSGLPHGPAGQAAAPPTHSAQPKLCDTGAMICGTDPVRIMSHGGIAAAWFL